MPASAATTKRRKPKTLGRVGKGMMVPYDASLSLEEEVCAIVNKIMPELKVA